MPAPEFVVLDVNETRSDLEPLRAAVLTGLLSHVDCLRVPVPSAVENLLDGVKALDVHADVPHCRSTPRGAGSHTRMPTATPPSGAACPWSCAMVAVHPWDLQGAAAVGMTCGWIDRRRTPWPAVFPEPDVTGATLGAVAEGLAAR